MYRFKKYIAFFLLLLVARVIIPDATVLDWHAHEHTQHDIGAEFELDKKHNHCQTDHFFNTSFTQASEASLSPLVLNFTDTYSARYCYVWKFTFPNNTDLRGPPAA